MKHPGHIPGTRERLQRHGWRGLGLAMAITGTFMVAELVGGLATNSLALLSDAGHMFADVAALGLALFALALASRPPSPRRSYGYLRTEVLAALFNGLALLLIVGYITYEATRRVQEPQQVHNVPAMLAVALLGLAANVAALRVLWPSAKHSMNIRGALLHIGGDLLGSLGAVIAGILMLTLEWYRSDAVIGLVIGALILVASAHLVLNAVHVLLEGTPPGVDLRKLERSMRSCDGVLAVHDLHAWMLTSGYSAMSAHVLVDRRLNPGQREGLLSRMREVVTTRFPIHHVTIQLEETAEGCEEAHTTG